MKKLLSSLCLIASVPLLSGCGSDPSVPKIWGGVGVLYEKEWGSALSIGMEKNLNEDLEIGVELGAKSR